MESPLEDQPPTGSAPSQCQPCQPSEGHHPRPQHGGAYDTQTHAQVAHQAFRVTGGESGPANTNGSLLAPTPGTSGTGAQTTITSRGKVHKRFDNNPRHRVHRHLKTTYAYRIGIRLPKEKLQQFPRYDGKVSDHLKHWRGSFVTFKVTPSKLRAILYGKQNPPRIVLRVAEPTATTSTEQSPPSLVSTATSTLEGGAGPRTPFASELSLPEGSNNGRDYLENESAGEQLVLAASGSFSADTRDRLRPPIIPSRNHRSTASFDSTISFSSGPGDDYEEVPVSERLIQNNTMAPNKDTSGVHNNIKDIIQHLTEIQIQTHGYLPTTQEILVDKLTDLTKSLAELKRQTSPTESPNNYIHQVAIAPEIVDYVDDGRNPDIFTRDFVENVQRGNAVINGKREAFRSFTQIFAEKLKEGIPGVSEQVDQVLKNVGIEPPTTSTSNGTEEGGAKGTDGRENAPVNG